MHGDDALSVANLAFNACASLPFWSVNDARRSAMGLATEARTKARRGRKLEVENIVQRWVWGASERERRPSAIEIEDEDEVEWSNQARRRVGRMGD